MEGEPITRQGYERLKRELARLEDEERVKIAQAIAQARAYGDLSENAEYQAAKEAQGQLEARIRQLRERLKRARIVEAQDAPTERVGVGSRVKLADLTHQQELELVVVGPGEADPASGRVSLGSPVGRALLGRMAGEVVRVQIPAGAVEYKILEIGR